MAKQPSIEEIAASIKDGDIGKVELPGQLKTRRYVQYPYPESNWAITESEPEKDYHIPYKWSVPAHEISIVSPPSMPEVPKLIKEEKKEIELPKIDN